MTTETTTPLTPDQLADAIDAEIAALRETGQAGLSQITSIEIDTHCDTFAALSLSVRNLSVRMTAKKSHKTVNQVIEERGIAPVSREIQELRIDEESNY